MPQDRPDAGARSTRPLFFVVLVLAICLLVPALREFAWVFGGLIVLVSLVAIAVFARRR